MAIAPMPQAASQPPASEPGYAAEQRSARSGTSPSAGAAAGFGTVRAQSRSPSSTDTEDEGLALSPNRLPGSQGNEGSGPLAVITEQADDEAVNHPMYEKERGNGSDVESLREEEEGEEEQDRHAMERLQIGGGINKEMSVKSGYLLKRGERSKVVGRTIWKKRYFVLRPDRLCYYKDDREYQILRHVAVAEVHACAEIAVKRHDNSFGIVTPKRTYYVKASSPQEMHDWVQTINRVRQDQVDLKERAEEAKKDQLQQQTAQSQEQRHQRRASARMMPAPGQQQAGQQYQQQPSAAQPPQQAPKSIAMPQNIAGIPAASPLQFAATSFSPSEFSTSADTANYLSSSYASNSSDLYMGGGGSSSSPSAPAHFGPGGLELGGLSESESLSASAAEPDRPFVMRARSQSNNAGHAKSGSVSGPGEGYFPSSPTTAGTLNRSLVPKTTPLLSSSEEDDDYLLSGGQALSGPDGVTPLASPPAGVSFAQPPPPPPAQPQYALLTKSALTADPNRVICNGYLMKQGKRKNWRKRWFVLTSQKLTYSRSHMDYKINRAIPLDSVLDVMEYVPTTAAPTSTRARPVSFSGNIPLSSSGPLSPSFEGPNSTSSTNAQSLEHGSPSGPGTGGRGKQLENCFKIITPSRTFLVCCPSEDDEIRWLSALRVLIEAGRRTESKVVQQQVKQPAVEQQQPIAQQVQGQPKQTAPPASAVPAQAVITQASQTATASSGNDTWQAGGNYPSIESKLEEARAPSATAYMPFTEPSPSKAATGTSSTGGATIARPDTHLPGGNTLGPSASIHRDNRTAVA